jgi:hypothetical protein
MSLPEAISHKALANPPQGEQRLGMGSLLGKTPETSGNSHGDEALRFPASTIEAFIKERERLSALKAVRQ